MIGRKFWCLAPAPSELDRVSSLTSAPYTVPGHLPKKAMRPSSSTTTRKPVSTDFDIADKLYFEPLTPEDVESIVDIWRSRTAQWYSSAARQRSS